MIGRLHAASRRVTPLDRRDTNRGVRTQGTIELTKMSGYRPTTVCARTGRPRTAHCRRRRRRRRLVRRLYWCY